MAHTKIMKLVKVDNYGRCFRNIILNLICQARRSGFKIQISASFYQTSQPTKPFIALGTPSWCQLKLGFLVPQSNASVATEPITLLASILPTTVKSTFWRT